MESVDLLSAINWPMRYLPGTTDNFVSNEVIVSGLSAEKVWPQLVDTDRWQAYYDNVSDITFPGGDGPELRSGMRFCFATFGFPIDARVTELVVPSSQQPARLSWNGRLEQDGELLADVLHGFLIEDLPGGRVRLLTQESQIGPAAKQVATERPNPFLNAHQAWIEGLASASRRVDGSPA